MGGSKEKLIYLYRKKENREVERERKRELKWKRYRRTEGGEIKIHRDRYIKREREKYKFNNWF